MPMDDPRRLIEEVTTAAKRDPIAHLAYHETRRIYDDGVWAEERALTLAAVG